MHIGEFIKSEKPKERVFKSERHKALFYLYSYYTTAEERGLRKKRNWTEYINWLKANYIDEKIVGRDFAVKKFRKEGKFISEYSERFFCIKMSHIPTEDLYFLLSVARDMRNRGQCFSSYLLSSIKPRDDSFPMAQ